MKKHKLCRCEDCENERYNPTCSGCGHHSSMWKTLVESSIWKEWCKEVSKRMNDQADRTIGAPYVGVWDVDEAQELGIMSREHFKDFIKWVKEEGYFEINKGIVHYLEHDRVKFLDGFAHSKDCKMCKLSIPPNAERTGDKGKLK